MLRSRLVLPALAAACAVAAWPALASAKPGAGTLADPVRADALPYALKGNTAVAPSNAIDSYDCSPATDESGPEVIYAFELPIAARVTAWVEGDGGTVDVDVHLLTSLNVQGGVASGCVSRNNRIAEANMAAGLHYVVVDSFQGAAQAGPYVLRLDAIGDQWNERPIAEGVVWRSRRYQDQSGGPQVVNALVVDTAAPGVEIVALQSSGCQTIGAMAIAAGAVAAVNGGYFNTMTCAPVSLLKSNGMLLATNGTKRGAFGLDANGVPATAVVAAGQDWPAVENAHGGGPTLALSGVAKNGNAAWAAEGFQDAAFNGKNPRTFAGFDAVGKVLLGTVDGRRDNAEGMSLDELAAYTVSDEFNATAAVNLDGGGSTTMWVKNATSNGVVNYPSDNPDQELPIHPGSRGVSGGFFVFADPYNHTPRFQTEPPTAAAVSEAYAYDADAIDLNVDDSLEYSLGDAPAGMTINAANGEIEYTPTLEAPPEIDVTVIVTDDKGAVAVQSFTLSIEGSLGTGAGGGGGTGGQAGGGQGGAGEGGLGEAGGNGEGGYEGGAGGIGIHTPQSRRCSCRLAGDDTDGSSGAIGFVLLALAFGARRPAIAPARCKP